MYLRGQFEHKADADLAAAAPDLLAACEAVVEWDAAIRKAGRGYTLDMAPIRAAIAKAKGE